MRLSSESNSDPRDATDHDLLSEEGVENVDAFVALTGIDEENIILSLYAKSQGAERLLPK